MFIDQNLLTEVRDETLGKAVIVFVVYLQRKDIVGGGVEPTDSDCDWPSDEEDEDDEELAVSSSHVIQYMACDLQLALYEILNHCLSFSKQRSMITPQEHIEGS